jgi:hypothetical protein
VELYGRVRRAVRVEGRSERAVALEFGILREMPRGKKAGRHRIRNSLGGYESTICEALETRGFTAH